MGEKGGSKSKVVVTSKLLVSLLPDSATLVPDKLKSANVNETPSASQLHSNPEDDNLWFKYLKVSKSPKLFEDACGTYPKYWKVYHRHALYHIFNNETHKAFEIYTEALKLINDYDLHLKYLIFLYHTASIHEYIAALITAVDRVGMDYRSDALWRELVTIMSKIYNCNLITLGIAVGLLPDLFTMDASGTTVPLMGSEAEQMVYRGVNTLDPSGKTYIELYGELNCIRKLFHKWLRTPTNNMRTLWDAYSTFENSVSSSTALSTKLLGDQKGVINASMRTYEKISEMYAKVYPVKAASIENSKPGTAFNFDETIESWLEIIKYEESNPMEVDTEITIERVLFTFELALSPLVFSNKMWYNYFQFLLFIGEKDKAVSELRLALNKYLKDDDKLKFVLAAYLEELGDTSAAALEFGNLISPGLKASGGDENEKKEILLRQILECKDSKRDETLQTDGIIHYLNFIRREKGMNAWREDIQLLLTRSELKSWELYWYAANTELRCFRDYDRAISILKQGQNKMAFNLKYTLLYLNTMLNIGRLNDVRVFLCEMVIDDSTASDKTSKYTTTDRVALWNFWMRMEYYFGTKEQFDNVKSLYISSKLSSEASMHAFTEKPRVSTGSSIIKLFSNIAESISNSDTSKRKAVAELSSIVEDRRKLFCAGVDFANLDNIFYFKNKTLIGGSTDSTEAVNYTEPIPVTKSTKCNSINVKVIRPNITRLSPVEPGLTPSLESLVQLHSEKRPLLPPKSRALDSIATPFKALFDFLRILPLSKEGSGSFSSLYVTPESVDYLIRSLDNFDFTNVDLQDYTPIPYNQIASAKSIASHLSGNDTFTEYSSEFNQGLSNIIRFLEDSTADKNEDAIPQGIKRRGNKIAI